MVGAVFQFVTYKALYKYVKQLAGASDSTAVGQSLRYKATAIPCKAEAAKLFTTADLTYS
jgi:hypothetical protein